jgi:adenylylsulfate kinase-like enzyme
MGQLAAASAAEVVLIAAINPYEQARQELSMLYGAKLVWIDCSIDILRLRDTKGLYRRAFLPGDHPEKLNNLTGVNDPFEHPKQADLIIYTHLEPVQVSAGRLTAYILSLPLPLEELTDQQNYTPPVV